jgi:hypothetical protein
MPHVSYLLAFTGCPWPGCGFRIQFVDFKVELLGDQSLYKKVMFSWGWQPEFGVIARCPGCRNHVWFGVREKRCVTDPTGSEFPVLPDDWHVTADIVAE